MIRFSRGILFAGGILAAIGAIPVRGQENLDAGKTPAQLYASDCAICHKTPNGLSKGGGIFGLSGFLREHYTSSRESAAAIAAYVQSVDKGPPPPAKKPGKRSAKGDDKGKPGEVRKQDSKPGEAKSGSKPEANTEPAPKPKSDEKSGEAKPATENAPKPGEAKTEEPKAESKPAAPKAEDKPPADASSEKKPD